MANNLYQDLIDLCDKLYDAFGRLGDTQGQTDVTAIKTSLQDYNQDENYLQKV